MEQTVSTTLCWFILCVNLTGLKDAQIVGGKAKTTFFLGESVGVSLEEVTI